MQKNAAHLAIPEIGPALQKRHIFAAHGRLPEGAISGVLKRTHHAGNVAQHGAFQFAFAQRSRRFAFKVENDEIFSGIEQLPEMIVAVNTDFRGIGAAIEQPFFAREYFLFRIEHFLRFISKCCGEIRQFLFEKGKPASQRCAHRLVNGALCHSVERLWHEGGIFHARGECKMQFARALPEQLRFVRVNPADQFIEKYTGRRCFILEISFTAKHPFVIAPYRVESERPAVALVCGSALQQTNNSGFSLWPAIFECSDESRHVWKIGMLREEPVYFDIRVHPILEFAIELKEEIVIEEH